MADWIKCSERMPDINTDVMVTDGRGVGMAACRRNSLGDKHFPVIHSGNDWMTLDTPTHWQPLPEPPQE